MCSRLKCGNHSHRPEKLFQNFFAQKYFVFLFLHVVLILSSDFSSDVIQNPMSPFTPTNYFEQVDERLQDVRSHKNGEKQMKELIMLLSEVDEYVSGVRLSKYERLHLVELKERMTSAMLDSGLDFMMGCLAS